MIRSSTAQTIGTLWISMGFSEPSICLWYFQSRLSNPSTLKCCLVCQLDEMAHVLLLVILNCVLFPLWDCPCGVKLHCSWEHGYDVTWWPAANRIFRFYASALVLKCYCSVLCMWCTHILTRYSFSAHSFSAHCRKPMMVVCVCMALKSGWFLLVLHFQCKVNRNSCSSFVLKSHLLMEVTFKQDKKFPLGVASIIKAKLITIEFKKPKEFTCTYVLFSMLTWLATLRVLWKFSHIQEL